MKINDMLAPPPVHLAADPAMAALGDNPTLDTLRETVVAHPTSSMAWALLAANARAEGDHITEYAFARTGYHRGLDALRGGGWKGFGPVPYSHEPNRGVLKAIAALALAAQAIGETNEYDRCRVLLSDCDPDCVATLLDGE